MNGLFCFLFSILCFCSLFSVFLRFGFCFLLVWYGYGYGECSLMIIFSLLRVGMKFAFGIVVRVVLLNDITAPVKPA